MSTNNQMTTARRLTRRELLRVATVGGVGAVLAACGVASQSAPTVAPTSAPAAIGASPGAYPRTIQDKFGVVAIPARPQRIMNFYGNAGLDALLALGEKPVLISTYDGFILQPWQAAANDVPFLIMSAGVPNQEKVFAEGIDLIITAEYPTATQAARDERLPFGDRIPIVSVDQADFEGQLRIIGDALALEEAAAAKAAEVAQLFADFQPARMPVTVKAFGNYEDGKFWMYREASGLGAMLKRFGLPALSAPTTIGDQESDPEAVQAISFEAMQELEADLLIGTDFGAGYRIESVAASPLFQQLQAVQDGRFVVFDLTESMATCYGSVLSIPAARDALTKALTAYAAAA
ncbi:MAG: ABC transporter substrate-binding protein [Blastochloris sp.]|nr:ABC transporter substrate-binding protein [Blastochloris sp.]